MDIRRHCQFLLDKEKDKPDAKLRYRIKWNNNRYIVAFNVGYRIDIDKWSTDTQRCKNNTTHGKRKVMASRINREIQLYESVVNDVFLDFEKKGHLPEPDEVRDAVNIRLNKKMPANHSLFDYMDEFVSEMGQMNSWTQNTYKMFAVIKHHLQDFNPSLSFDDLDENGLYGFVDYLRDARGLRNITVSKQLRFVKWFLRWATAKGYNSKTDFSRFSPKLKTADKKIIFLDWDELMRVYNFRIPDEGTNVTLYDYNGNEYQKRYFILRQWRK